MTLTYKFDVRSRRYIFFNIRHCLNKSYDPDRQTDRQIADRLLHTAIKVVGEDIMIIDTTNN